MKQILTTIMITIFLFSCATTKSYQTGSEWKEKGITELTTIKLGGINQAVLIRGTNLNNTIYPWVEFSYNSICAS